MSNRFSFISVIFLIVLSIGAIQAQKFSGTAVLGLNAAQIDGDGIYGYDKFGITGGLRLGYQVANKTNILLELLYSQRGSAPDISFSGDRNTIDLKYIEIPLLVEYNDWYIEDEDYYKVGIEGGLSYGNLFSVTSSNEIAINELGGYKKHDLSYTVGLRYSINKRWAGVFRYSKSIIRIYKNEDSQLDGLLSHWLSFRLQFTI